MLQYALTIVVVGLIPWPSLSVDSLPAKLVCLCVFECLQYTKMKGEDLVNLI